jgi:protein-tyrosine phosphatase
MNIPRNEPRKVLFICTGNYYRSRFAEALFNFLAQKHKLNWIATSRGLATYLVGDDGFLSSVVVKALHERDIPASFTAPSCRQVTETDFREADLLIAIDKFEHRPLLDRYYHDWVDKVAYWDVSDVEELAAMDAIPRIERNILTLIGDLERADLKREADAARGAVDEKPAGGY